jgi:uncharacterized iron-regulated membrane protein
MATHAMPAVKARLSVTRQFWVILHRWAGLTLALFLAVAGFTGIFIAWIDELDTASAPQLHLAAPPYAGASPLDTLTIREKALRRYPGSDIHFLPLEVDEGRSLQFFVEWPDPETGLERANAPDWNQVFINPYTGEELGRRKWGDITQGMVNLMPFIYRLHYSLALGDWGLFIFGLAALIWTLDCFVGFCLTLPVRQRRAMDREAKAPLAGWWKRWRPSWAVRWNKSRYKLNFDLHRAGGLWLWPLLLVFAWSSVSFNLPQVYVPVMKLLGGKDQREAYFSAMLPKPRNNPAISYRAALDRGRALARTEADKAGLTLSAHGETYLWHTPETGMYVYYFTTNADISKHGAGTLVAFDSNSGALRRFEAPTGQNAANTFTTWITMLHTAHVFGLPWRIMVSLIGALVTMLSVTGIVIWMRKRSSRMIAGRAFMR